MRIMRRRTALFAVVALAMCAGLSQADTRPPEAKASATTTKTKSKSMRREGWGPHHGQVALTKSHRFETVLSANGIDVYVSNPDHSPVTLPTGVTGTATLKLHDGTTQDVALSLATDVPSGGQSRLVGTTDLFEKIQAPAMVKIEIKGLDGPEKDVSFHETYRPRMHEENRTQSSSPSSTQPSGQSSGSSSQSGQH